jgi:hypothetical protein
LPLPRTYVAVAFAAFASDADGCHPSYRVSPVRGELMDSFVFVVGALLLGLWVGASFARAKRARADLRGTKKLVSGLRTRMWNTTFHSLRAMLLLAGVVFVFVLGLRAAGRM